MSRVVLDRVRPVWSVGTGSRSRLSLAPARRPGRDVIHLVTVVAGYMYVDGGQALLDSHYASVARELVEARQEVLVSRLSGP